MSQLCQFSIYQNCIKKVHLNDVNFLPTETKSNKVRQNDADFLPIEITSKKVRRKDVTNWICIKKICRNDVQICQHFAFDVWT